VNLGLATCDPPAVFFDDGAFARGDDEIGGDCTLRYPLNNGYRSLWNGRYTSPDPLHLKSQLRFIGAQAYTYAAHRPQVNQDPDGREIDGGWDSALAFGLVTPEQVAGYQTAALTGAMLGLTAFGGLEAAAMALTPARAWLAARLAPLGAAFDRLGGSGCGPDTGRRTREAAEVFRRLERYHGIPESLSSDRLHAIKEALGRGGADNVLFDLTGNVFDPETGEWLGSLTQGGGKR